MPTYDYLCTKCGFEGEYRNVPSDSHPDCLGCGSREGMKRMPASPSLTGLANSRSSSDDMPSTMELFGRKFSKVGDAECPDCGEPGTLYTQVPQAGDPEIN